MGSEYTESVSAGEGPAHIPFWGSLRNILAVLAVSSVCVSVCTFLGFVGFFFARDWVGGYGRYSFGVRS
jgi:hypothetical protein